MNMKKNNKKKNIRKTIEIIPNDKYKKLLEGAYERP